jgi:protein ImuB
VEKRGKAELALFSPAARQQFRVLAVSQAMSRYGVRPEMLLAEAQSLCPRRVTWELHDPSADRDELRRLAHGCAAFSPWVALDPLHPPEALALDVTDCDFNYGGEQPLLHAIQQWFAHHGYHVSLALTDTWGSAWALAHQPQPEPIRVVPSGQHIQALQSLPVELLRLPAETAALLHQFDIRHIGQLLALPRADLPSRFGDELLQRLDQALGTVPELLTPERAPEWVEASWTCEPPVADRLILQNIISHLLETICHELEPQQMGVQQLWCLLTQEPRETQHFPVILSRPSLSRRHLTDLIRLHLERLEVSGEITAVTLRVVQKGPLETRQTHWFDHHRTDDEHHWRILWEQLISRLGASAVGQPRLCPEIQPERAFTYESANTPAASAIPEASHGRPPVRPIRLLREPVAADVISVIPGGPPLRFWWEQRLYDVSQCWGPERIETGWWHGDDVRRDYYLVETMTRERFWLFRTVTDNRWWLHGLFV